jgi:hypothetical protein
MKTYTHGDKRLASAKQKSSPSNKYFNGLVYLVFHAAEADLKIASERRHFSVQAEA